MKFIALITSMMICATSLNAASNVKAGDTISEDGVFLTTIESAQILAEKKVSTERCNEKIEYASKSTQISEQMKIKNLEIDLASEKEKNQVIISSKDKEIDRLYKQIEEEGGEYDAYFIVGGMVTGVIVTALVSTAIFFAAVQTAKSESVIK